MESSDESFVFSKASNDSSSNDSKYEVINKSKINRHSMVSESKAVSVIASMENILNQETVLENSLTGIKRKKRKNTSNEELFIEPKKKRIMIKTESDVEESKGKLYDIKYEYTMQSDDSYLNMKVKEEQMSATDESVIKIKKKKKHKKEKNTFDDTITQTSGVQKKSPKMQETSVGESCLENNLHMEEKSLTKESEDEQDKRVKKKKKKKNKRSTDDMMMIENEIQPEGNSISRIEFNESADRNGCLIEDTVEAQEGKLCDTTLPDRTMRMSDRIRFEDDSNISSIIDRITASNDKVKGNASTQLKKFIQSMTNSQTVAINAHEGPVILEDDEIWLIKCPRDIDINFFKGKYINVDSKTKLKINGQTYEGHLDDNNIRLPLVTARENHMIIKSYPIKACISFHKRIPKQNTQLNESMIKMDMNNPIPLPDTKLRHPLFGANYKKSIEIPLAVMECLNSQNDERLECENKLKRKKHKKKKSVSENAIHKVLPDINEENVSSVKKNKKRKHCEQNVLSHKKVKRVKYDPDCAETWDSEKAIEETLFNF